MSDDEDEFIPEQIKREKTRNEEIKVSVNGNFDVEEFWKTIEDIGYFLEKENNK